MVTKEDIKEAAFILFANKGYEATTTNDIADAVGLKKQSLYSHFNSKSALYLEILEQRSDIMNEEIINTIQKIKDDTTEELLKGVFRCIAEIFSQREYLLFWKRAFIIHSSGENKEISEDKEWRFDKKLRENLYGEIRQRYKNMNDPIVLMNFFMSYLMLIQGYIDWMMFMGHNESTFQIIWQNFWSGAGKYF